MSCVHEIKYSTPNYANDQRKAVCTAYQRVTTPDTQIRVVQNIKWLSVRYSARFLSIKWSPNSAQRSWHLFLQLQRTFIQLIDYFWYFGHTFFCLAMYFVKRNRRMSMVNTKNLLAYTCCSQNLPHTSRPARVILSGLGTTSSSKTFYAALASCVREGGRGC